MQGANKRTANAAVSGPERKARSVPERPAGPKRPYVVKDHERVIASRRENSLGYYRPPDDPELLEANRVRRALALQAAIQREADSDPPLSLEQRSQLAMLLLRPNAGDKG
jgi:hypothetical protein